MGVAAGVSAGFIYTVAREKSMIEVTQKMTEVGILQCLFPELVFWGIAAGIRVAKVEVKAVVSASVASVENG